MTFHLKALLYTFLKVCVCKDRPKTNNSSWKFSDCFALLNVTNQKRGFPVTHHCIYPGKPHLHALVILRLCSVEGLVGPLRADPLRADPLWLCCLLPPTHHFTVNLSLSHCIQDSPAAMLSFQPTGTPFFLEFQTFSLSTTLFLPSRAPSSPFLCCQAPGRVVMQSFPFRLWNQSTLTEKACGHICGSAGTRKGQCSLVAHPSTDCDRRCETPPEVCWMVLESKWVQSMVPPLLVE